MAVKGADGFSALFSDSIFFCEFVERTLMIEVQYDLFLQQSLVIFLERCRVQPISGVEMNILSYKCVPVLTNSNTSSIIEMHIEYRICTFIKTTFR